MCPRKGAVNDDERVGLTRRNCLAAAGALVGGAAALGSGSVVQRGAAQQSVIDLGEEGLSPGDTIDGYLDDYFRSGVEVHVPAGDYRWNGTGLGGGYEDAALIGDGEVVWRFARDYWNFNLIVENGGDLLLKNITVRGRVNSGQNKSRIRIDCRHPDSVATLDNFNLPDGSSAGDAAMALYVGKPHEGTVNLRDVHIEGWNNNGLYSGASEKRGGGGGTVNISHSFFKDMNIDAVRLGGSGDSIVDTVIDQADNEVDDDGNYSGRALRVRYPGDDITVRNVHISSNLSSPFIVASRMNGSGSGTVEDLYIENNTGATAVNVARGDWTADGVSVTGSGNRVVTGFDDARNVSTDGSGPSPAKTLAELDERMGVDPAPEPDPEPEPEPEPDGRLLTISGDTGVEKSYSFSVSGSVEQTTDNGASINPDDVVVDNGVDGKMFAGADSFRFDGEITAFSADDGITVTLDGTEVDPDALGGPAFTNTITIRGSEEAAETYEFTVSEAVRKSTVNGASINSDDAVEGTTATGQVFGSTDSYEFAGELTAFEYEGNPTVLVNGEEIDPDPLDPGPANTISIVSPDGIPARYEFVVDGAVDPSTANGGTYDDGDTIEDGTVAGRVNGGTDSYGFDGEITYFKFDGVPTVLLNGEAVDPDDLAPSPSYDDTITVRGTGTGVSTYEFSVSDSVRKSTAGGASINGDDGVDWRTASGRIRYGADSYAVAGEITDFSADGDVTVLVNGDEVDPAALGR